MVAGLLDNILTRTDNLFEKMLRPPGQEVVSFRDHLSRPRKILLIPGVELLELIQALGFVPPLLEQFPQAEVHLLVAPEQGCLLEGLERVRPVACGCRNRFSFGSGFRRVAAALREGRFDWALNLTNSGRAELLLTRYSGARIRTGLACEEDDSYYNLIVRNIPAASSLPEQVAALFQALHVRPPLRSGLELLAPTADDRERAAHFLRRRKSARSRDCFIGCALELPPGKAARLERPLQAFIAGLTARLDPLHLLIAGNLVPEDQLRKLAASEPYLHCFPDLRQLVAVLAACDRVLTNSVGLAWLLGRMEVPVGLLGDPSRIERLPGEADRSRIRVLPAGSEGLSLPPALEFIN